MNRLKVNTTGKLKLIMQYELRSYLQNNYNWIITLTKASCSERLIIWQKIDDDIRRNLYWILFDDKKLKRRHGLEKLMEWSC